MRFNIVRRGGLRSVLKDVTLITVTRIGGDQSSYTGEDLILGFSIDPIANGRVIPIPDKYWRLSIRREHHQPMKIDGTSVLCTGADGEVWACDAPIRAVPEEM